MKNFENKRRNSCKRQAPAPSTYEKEHEHEEVTH